MLQSYLELRNEVTDPYQSRVEEVYSESAQIWEKVLGPGLWFQYGIFDDDDDDDENHHTLPKSGQRYLERQLVRSQEMGFDISNVHRTLDVGCGWGDVISYLAQRLPKCRLIEGVNISRQQLDYCEKKLNNIALHNEIKLYLCNAKDINLLPNNNIKIDLALFRGSIAHFSYHIFEETMANLSPIMADKGRVIISETLYNIPLEKYQSSIEDKTDRLACGYRKTRDYVLRVLAERGFKVESVEVLPNYRDAIRWFRLIQRNIEAEFTGQRPPIIAELHDCAENLIAGFKSGIMSVYSIIAVPDQGYKITASL